jgi:FMN phosphatase YigB (HAD superfamily)
VAAVTLALWGTIFDDGPERRQAETAWRKHLVVARLVADGTCGADVAEHVWDTAVATFREAWLQHGQTPGLAYCLGEGLAACGLFPREGFDGLVAELENRALTELPTLVPGVHEALAALSERWSVGVVCDTRITPAPILRDCLRAHKLSKYIDVAVFSDEIGAAKPSRLPFRIAAEELGVNPDEIVHVGPSEDRDVEGAAAVGAWAIHLGSGPTCADAQCAHLGDIADAVQRLLTA